MLQQMWAGCAMLAWLMTGPCFTAALAQDEKRDSANKSLPQPTRVVEYKVVQGKALKLHVFEPSAAAPTSGSKRAAILFFFGGGWTNGSPTQFYPQAKHLADLGMWAACADYRVRSRDNAQVTDCVADAQDAVAYVRKQSEPLGIDPGRIVAAGGSAGGHLAAACATLAYRGQNQLDAATYRPDALVLFNPALVLAVSDQDRELVSEDQKKIRSLAARFGDKPESLSPYHQLTATLPPTLILHGRADTTVPYRTVEMFTAKAKQLGRSCQLVGYPDQSHGFFNYGRKTNMYQATLEEMVKFLEGLGYVGK